MDGQPGVRPPGAHYLGGISGDAKLRAQKLHYELSGSYSCMLQASLKLALSAASVPSA